MTASESADMDTESADDEAAPASAATAPPPAAEAPDPPADVEQTGAARRRQEQLIARDSGMRLVSARPGEEPVERIFRPTAEGNTEAIAFPTMLRNRINCSICAAVGPRTPRRRLRVPPLGTAEIAFGSCAPRARSAAPCSWRQRNTPVRR